MNKNILKPHQLAAPTDKTQPWLTDKVLNGLHIMYSGLQFAAPSKVLEDRLCKAYGPAPAVYTFQEGDTPEMYGLSEVTGHAMALVWLDDANPAHWVEADFSLLDPGDRFMLMPPPPTEEAAK